MTKRRPGSTVLRRVPFAERLSEFVRLGKGPCWNWPGSTRATNGYGVTNVRDPEGKYRTRQAHRLAYEALIGPVPEGLTLDHLCRNRACFNPWHCEPVTRGENVRRGEGRSAKNARKTHCNRGHPLSGDNLYVYAKTGGRQCRACRRVEVVGYRPHWKPKRADTSATNASNGNNDPGSRLRPGGVATA